MFPTPENDLNNLNMFPFPIMFPTDDDDYGNVFEEAVGDNDNGDYDNNNNNNNKDSDNTDDRRSRNTARRREIRHSQDDAARTLQADQRNAQDRQRRQRSTNIARLGPLDTIDDTNPIYIFDCGKMEKNCNHCGAFYWEKEKNSSNRYTKCCMNGVNSNIPLPEKPPPFIEVLLTGKTDAICGIEINERLAYHNRFQLKPVLLNSSTSFASTKRNCVDTKDRPIDNRNGVHAKS